MANGLPVYATATAALTVHDSPERVEAMGVILTDQSPAGVITVRCGDLQRKMLGRMLAEVGEELPANFAIAVQDHGYAPGESNRIFRFRMWERFMAAGGRLTDLAYGDIPDVFTRMLAAREDAPGALIMDTCAAALFGALTDETVAQAAREGIVAVINLGNQHTIAALLNQKKIFGLFEHHTGQMNAQKTQKFLHELCMGRLTNQEIQDDGGHGCLAPTEAITPELIVVTGPRRHMLSSKDYYFAAPHGNMMLMGCYGLVEAVLQRNKIDYK